jgi:enoyl-CoA hydratase
MATPWKLTLDGDLAFISLDDGKANTVLAPEFRALEATLAEVQASSAKAVVLTGRAGYFSAGLNLKVLGTLTLDGKREVVEAMGRAVLTLFRFPLPVVAAVSGHALGAGAMFALAADVRLFADGPFKFGLNEVQVGLFVPSYAIELARAAVSPSRLTDLVLHGRPIGPQEALSMHVAEAVVAPEQLLAAATERAKGLVPLSHPGYAMTKQLLRAAAAEQALARLPGELSSLAQLLDAKR